MILTRPPSRQDRQNTLSRWLKFNLVGAMGIVVQLGMLHFFTSGLGTNYLLATALAVEAALLHNFVWHERFTWADRAGLTGRGALDRLLRFNLTTGVISVTGNIVLMSLLVEQAHLPFLPANLVTIAFCSLANFVVSDRFVFCSGAGAFQRELAAAAPDPHISTTNYDSPRPLDGTARRG